MSVKYWEYQGTTKLLYDTHVKYHTRFMKEIRPGPIPTFCMDYGLDTFRRNKLIFLRDKNTNDLLSGDYDQYKIYLHWFWTWVLFASDYENKPNHFHHLSIDYSRGDFNIDYGRTRIRFMKAVEYQYARAWIRSDEWDLPEEIMPYVTEVSLQEIHDQKYAGDYISTFDPSTGKDIGSWGVQRCAVQDPIQEEWNQTRRMFGSDKIADFLRTQTLKFSRTELNQELRALHNVICDTPDWYIDMHSDLSTSEYNSKNITSIALAFVFAQRPIETPLFSVKRNT